ncbi:putative regulatory subunit of protein kinase a-like protein, partial [Trypanosoma conorhini]
MSKFDKSVCDWISSASIDLQSKHEILANVINTIDRYKEMEEAAKVKKPPISGRPTAWRKRQPREQKDASAIDYKFSEEVNEAIYQLDHPEISPVPPTVTQEQGNEQANEKENANAIEENANVIEENANDNEENANVVEESERENEENEHVSATEENVNAIEENANENEENANENEENANVIEETERENEENEH